MGELAGGGDAVGGVSGGRGERVAVATQGAGTLYLCATPLGNLGDITIRAIEAMRQADVVLAEDTRRSLGLLRHYGVEARLVSFHDHNERSRTPQVLDWLSRGMNVALVSDAGSPGLADPGYYLVRAVIAAGLPVTVLPGPSALVAALTVSGLPAHAFIFQGFVPRKDKARRDLLASLREEERTAVFYETPHRLVATLETLLDTLGPGRPVAVARELTKVFEEIVRGTAAEVLERFRERPPRGEMVLLIGGRDFRWPGTEAVRGRGSPPRPPDRNGAEAAT